MGDSRRGGRRCGAGADDATVGGLLQPKAAAYVTLWRPWRTHLTLRFERTLGTWPENSTMTAEYHDPWPGEGRTPGGQFNFITLTRLSPWLPWVVTEQGTGP